LEIQFDNRCPRHEAIKTWAKARNTLNLLSKIRLQPILLEHINHKVHFKDMAAGGVEKFATLQEHYLNVFPQHDFEDDKWLEMTGVTRFDKFSSTALRPDNNDVLFDLLILQEQENSQAIQAFLVPPGSPVPDTAQLTAEEIEDGQAQNVSPQVS